MKLITDQIWSMREAEFRAITDGARSLILKGVVQLDPEAAAPRGTPGMGDTPPYEIRGGVAEIKLSGVMTKNESFFTRYFGGVSSIQLANATNLAAVDQGVRAIMVRIDSPGGAVAGTSALADAIYNARKTKRVYAQIEDIGASGAYRAASQADRIFATRDARVGSIGTYMVVDDMSKFYENAGVKTHVIRAGEFKGAGTEGTELTEPQLANFQREVNALNEHFITDVARGRGLSIDAVRSMADGRVYVGREAMANRMIDGVQSAEQTLSDLQSGGSLRINAA